MLANPSRFAGNARTKDYPSTMARLTDAERLRIVHLAQEKQTVASIAKKVHCSEKSVRFWIHNFPIRGSTKSVAAKGRPHVLDTAAKKRAVQLLLEGKTGGARFVAQQLFREGLTERLVSPGTVLRGAKLQAREDGDELICRRGRPPKKLSETNREQRVTFAVANKSRCWAHVMFTDRCKFHFRYPGTSVRTSRWLRKSKKHEDGAFTAAHASVYNVYGGVTRYGTTKLHPVTGTTGAERKYTNLRGVESKNITQQEYRDVLKDTLLREGTRIFATQGMSCWTLQQDKDPTHARAADVVNEYNSKHSGTVVDLLRSWPGNSPDFSPIENVWGYVDSEVAKIGCKTFAEFKCAVDVTFKNVSKQMCAKMFQSVPERMQRCIDLDGARTGY